MSDQSTTQAPAKEPTTLKEKLKKMRMPVDDINKFLAYVQEEKTKEAAKRVKDSNAFSPVTSNTDEMLYTMAFRWFGLGLIIDGVNIVITGRGMAMPTYNGYKNKVRQSYPTAKFDVQLVREGDEFSVSKEDAAVHYKHTISDPFGSGEIKGAYCVISIDGRDYFESLNPRDYTEMKNSSKQSRLWDKWESEFWLKSVIKRACKRHLYDEVKEIDEADNELYGLKPDESTVSEERAKQIAEASKPS